VKYTGPYRLQQLAAHYGHKPGAIVRTELLDDERAQLEALGMGASCEVELAGWPFYLQEFECVYVNVRAVPGDPTTMTRIEGNSLSDVIREGTGVQ
jgi:hypothetical protein